MSKKYSDQDVHDLISKVEAEFAQHLAKSEAKTKEEGQPLEKTEIEKCGEIQKSDEAPAAFAPAEAKKDDEPKEQPKDQNEDHGYDEMDKEELKKLYSDMSDSERALHKAALEACQSQDQQLQKSEEKQEEKVPAQQESEELKLAKAEAETLKKNNEELQAQVGELLKKFAQKIVKPAPARKAVTELGALEKSEKETPAPKSKAEIVKTLTQMARGQDLKKSDRDAINAYVVGATGLETISHLLK